MSALPKFLLAHPNFQTLWGIWESGRLPSPRSIGFYAYGIGVGRGSLILKQERAGFC